MKARRPDVTNFGTKTMSSTKRKFTATEDHTGRSDTSLKCCPINNTLGIIGKNFTILILRNMIYGKQSRFNQLGEVP
jgi:DNA-binding HxlR family transcriptional regulator